MMNFDLPYKMNVDSLLYFVLSLFNFKKQIVGL